MLNKNDKNINNKLYHYYPDFFKKENIGKAMQSGFHKTLCLLMDFFIEYDSDFLKSNSISVQILFTQAVECCNINMVLYFKEKKAPICINISKAALHPASSHLYLFNQSILFQALEGLREKGECLKNTPILIDALIDMGANFEEDKLHGPTHIQKRAQDCSDYSTFREKTKAAILHSFEKSHMYCKPLVDIITDYVLLKEPSLVLEKVENSPKKSRVN